MAESDAFLALSAIVGALVTLDAKPVQENAREIIPWAVGLLALDAAVMAESVRGFFYLLAMPIGLFVTANVAAGLMLTGWRRWRS